MKKIIGWYKKQKNWIKGGVTGIISGLVVYILSFVIIEGELSQIFWGIAGKPFCTIFRVELGEPCAFTYLFYGWLFLSILYGLIGLLVGFIIDKIKK